MEAGTSGLRDYGTTGLREQKVSCRLPATSHQLFLLGLRPGAGLGRREECGARAIRLLAAASVSEAAAVVAIGGAGRLKCSGNER